MARTRLPVTNVLPSPAIELVTKQRSQRLAVSQVIEPGAQCAKLFRSVAVLRSVEDVGFQIGTPFRMRLAARHKVLKSEMSCRIGGLRRLIFARQKNRLGLDGLDCHCNSCGPGCAPPVAAVRPLARSSSALFSAS